MYVDAYPVIDMMGECIDYILFKQGSGLMVALALVQVVALMSKS